MSDVPTLHLEVVTPYSIFFDAIVEMVVVTAKDGEIGILPGHTALMAALMPGELRLKLNGQWKLAAASNGYAEVGPDLVVVVVNAAEWAEDIDMERAQKAMFRSEAKLSDPSAGHLDKERARNSILRAKSRMKVGGKVKPTGLVTAPPGQ